MKKVILGILLGLSLSTISVVALNLCNAKDIEYKASDTSWDVDTVEDALNDLYQGNGNLELSEEISEYLKNTISKTFNFTGKPEEFVVPVSATYKIELWGSRGGDYSYQNRVSNKGGKGGYVSGIINLKKGEVLEIYVGGLASGTSGGYNGGGKAGSYVGSEGTYTYAGGGGATDVRYKGNALESANANINARIMVAGGGGGAGWYTNGGDGGNITITSLTLFSPAASVKGGGGGGGFFAGDPGGTDQSGTGGTSYVSGCNGCKSVKSDSDSTIIDNPNHYSGKIFTDIVITPGINESAGKAVITYLGTQNN